MHLFNRLSYKMVNKMLSGKIICPRADLDLGITLMGGQSFRWVPLDEDTYRGVFSGSVWTLSQSEDHVNYTVNATLDAKQDFTSILYNYFRLEVCLQEQVQEWSKVDAHFAKIHDTTLGVRMLDQDIVENLFSFICSSNNNITRISGMVEKLSRFFGQQIGEVDSKEYYNFPTISELTKSNVESTLRKEGFGYRAKYIAESAMSLETLGGRQWLTNLHKSNSTYKNAKEQLMTLSGIGPKVADCICLMSLGHLDAIPVDTHIFQVASAIYMPHLKSQKTVTPKIHQEISQYFQELWGPLAGWAQTIVFCAKINNNIPHTNKRKSKKNVAENVETKKRKSRNLDKT